jgi:thiopeptide-type bacteriocin biosynthesis protein
MQTLYRPNTSYINFGGINLSNYIYVPRISYEDVIISPASWNIKKAYFKDNFSINDLKEFIKKYEIPRFVHLYEFGEEKMIFDLENDTILKIIINEIKKKHIICLNESFFSKGTENSYKEYIYFLSYKNKENISVQENPGQNLKEEKIQNIQRSFTLGSEWIYIKLYCGIGTGNKILSGIHHDLITNLLNEGIIDKWFFIRYKDPDFHLRIRFHVTDLSNIGQIIARINEACQQFVNDKFIWKIDYSTYERELERYSWDFIEKAETIFFADSETAVNAIRNDDPEYADWYKIFLSIQGYYDAFDFDLDERLSIMTNIYNGFFKEFGSPKTLNKEINKKFENNYKQLYQFIENKEYEKAFSIFDVRNNIIKETVGNLGKNEKYRLIDSLIHMTVNRLVESNPRLHELIVYGLLMKYFKKQVGLKNSVLQ